jgi:electron transfer flavoprotein alpha subunit
VTTRFINPSTISKPPGYTHVVEATTPGRIVYIAGQLGLDLQGNVAGAPGDFRAQAKQTFENYGNEHPNWENDLTAADIIVSVGRGIKEKENIHVVEELAKALGAELAASRPICDAGWLPMERQVGSSGQTVAPKVYMAVGISGAIQHLVGMKGAKTIVAINKDANAPIFEVADYGIVGDLFEVVPALTSALKQAR